MKFSKNQTIALVSVAILLVFAMTFSSAYSAAAAVAYIRAGAAQTVVAETGGSDKVIQNTTEPQQTEPQQTGQTTEAPAGTDVPVVVVTNAQTGGGTTTKKANDTPSTNEEIAELFRTANKNAKTKAKKATLTYKYAGNYKEVVEAGFLSSIGQLLMGAFLKEEPDLNEVHENDLADVFPPTKATCNLKASDINKATCVDKGTYYFITILVKPDTNPKAGYGSGSICSVITVEQIKDPLTTYKVEASDVLCEYDGAYCEAKIDKKTGNLIEYYFDLPMYLSLTAKAPLIPAVSAKVGLEFKEKWTIEY